MRPEGVVTFLFTDIEGSTRRWEADADAMRLALATHDKVLRTAIEAHDGFVFSHNGDGFAAGFASPNAAVEAAIAAQRELELPVRMGIATGEAELRDDDYFGTVLNRAARMTAAGHGGQILVADATAGLLSGFDLTSLGSRRLRDVPTPVTVYQLQVPGLRREFPPLRGLDAGPGNLRHAPTSLIGREAEVGEIAVALRSRRLITLTGVGGVGKTRMALEVATRLAGEFGDGVWIFELATVTDPAAVPDAVASVLGLVQQAGKTVTESVAAAMEGRQRLLVFDNCEHVVDAAAELIESILTHAATAKILATSREGLGLAEERLWRVPSLDVDAAVGLFTERADSVSADEISAVEDVCRRLDGIPLAIELAASRMSSMSVTEVRDRLDHRFNLLVGSRRGLERHQTLRHAVAWSFDLLDDREKVLLERCSVFAGGFDIQSACAVAGLDRLDEFEILELLDALVRKSLLVADRASRQTRFMMLETIRQFAEEQLVARAEASEVRAAHARYFAGREADVMALWDSPRQTVAYEWFTVELSNLRAGFRYAADSGDVDAAAAIATYGAFFGAVWLGIFEPISWAEELIDQAREREHLRLAFLYVMASLCWQQGRIEAALRYSEAGQATLSSGRGRVPFGVGSFIGGAYVAAGQPERYVEITRAQLEFDRDSGSLARAAHVMALMTNGSQEEAVAVAADLINPAEVARNPSMFALALLAYGYAFWEADPVRALDAVRRGLTVAQDSGCRMIEAHLAMSLCRLEALHGDGLAALEHCAVAIRSYHDAGNISQLRIIFAILAAFLERHAHHQSAAVIAGFAASAFTTATVSEFETATGHLREVLGEEGFESLLREGRSRPTSAMVTFVYEQIDQARAQLLLRR